MNDTAKIKVVVADDSAFMRRLIADTLTKSGMEVAAEVGNGRDALDACQRHKPDVLSLDLAMPQVDGLQVLRTLRNNSDMRVVVVSSFDESAGARAVEALAEGAFDLVPKLNGSGTLADFTAALVSKITAAAHESPPTKPAFTQRLRTKLSGGGRLQVDGALAEPVVVIATSTGGPRALATVLPELPAVTGAGVLIVQHMPSGFTRSLAERLDQQGELTIKEAQTGDVISPEHALIAPGGSHMRIVDGKVEITDDVPINGLRPCADVTITDVVGQYGGRVLLVVLTGMGRDAASGARAVHEAGGLVIAEDSSSCTVYGMPRAVIEDGLADSVLPLEKIAEAIKKIANG